MNLLDQYSSEFTQYATIFTLNFLWIFFVYIFLESANAHFQKWINFAFSRWSHFQAKFNIFSSFFQCEECNAQIPWARERSDFWQNFQSENWYVDTYDPFLITAIFLRSKGSNSSKTIVKITGMSRFLSWNFTKKSEVMKKPNALMSVKN
jgi:hypothetical protein